MLGDIQGKKLIKSERFYGLDGLQVEPLGKLPGSLGGWDFRKRSRAATIPVACL
jgi:hypothetical protein